MGWRGGVSTLDEVSRKAFLKIWHLPYDLNNENTKIGICGESFLVEELTDAKVLRIV